MARRNRNNNGVSRGQFLAVLAFVVLIVAAIVWILSAVALTGPIVGVTNLLLNIAIVGVIAIAAFPFAKANRRSAWWIIYWIIVIVALVGAAIGGIFTII